MFVSIRRETRMETVEAGVPKARQHTLQTREEMEAQAREILRDRAL